MEESDYDVEDFQDLKYELSEQLQDQMSTLDDYMGEGWKFSYEITNDEKVEGDDLDDIKKDMKRQILRYQLPEMLR